MNMLFLMWMTGIKGIPIPYSPRQDDGITILLLCCFFMSAYVLSRSRKFLAQLAKNFMLNRERTSIFDTTECIPPYILFGTYLTVCLLYFFLKWLVYTYLGWIFFDTSRTSLWMESYSTLLYYLGLTLFPFALFLVYFDLNLLASVIIGLFLAIFTKILIFYKWMKLFCDNLYGVSLLIMYFCALEIVPCCLLYQGILQLNDYLIIKF